jgi:hypothetical protein
MSRSQGEEGERQLLGALGAERAIQTYSAGIKLAQVARGEADLYLGDYLTLRDWDVAAGHVLVTEAGGRVTSVDGDPVRYDGSGRVPPRPRHRRLERRRARCGARGHRRRPRHLVGGRRHETRLVPYTRPCRSHRPV